MTLRKHLEIYPYHFASVLSIAACFWLFFKYTKQMEKGVKHLLVIILAFSDLIYSTNHLLEDYWQEYFLFEKKIGFFIDSFSICFSIFWASAIAFIAYKNLDDRYINLKALFIKVLLVVLALAMLVASLDSWNSNFDLWMAGFVVISLIVTIVFYQKSINILRDHLQYEQKSIWRYIRNLRYFSAVQLLTYGPAILESFIGFFVEFDYDTEILIFNCCTTFACLSGFLSVSGFACQGGFDSENGFGSDDAAKEDLTSGVLTRT